MCGSAGEPSQTTAQLLMRQIHYTLSIRSSSTRHAHQHCRSMPRRRLAYGQPERRAINGWLVHPGGHGKPLALAGRRNTARISKCEHRVNAWPGAIPLQASIWVADWVNLDCQLSCGRYTIEIPWRPVGDSNPCCRRERAVSWASRRTGPRPTRAFYARTPPCSSALARGIALGIPLTPEPTLARFGRD